MKKSLLWQMLLAMLWINPTYREKIRYMREKKSIFYIALERNLPNVLLYSRKRFQSIQQFFGLEIPTIKDFFPRPYMFFFAT